VCLRELILYIRHRVLSNTGLERASPFDELAVVDLYNRFGSKFIRTAIGTMCSLPVFYTGLSEVTSDTAQWPPKLRIRFLVEKALLSLEYSVKGVYINTTGNDVFNELVSWSLEDIIPTDYFPQTQLVEFMRKQSLEAQRLFGRVGYEQNHLMALLADLAYEVLSEKVLDPQYSVLEQKYLTELSSFLTLPVFFNTGVPAP